MQPRSIQETDLFTHVHWGKSTFKKHRGQYISYVVVDYYTKTHSPEFSVKQWEIIKLLEYKYWSPWGLSSHKKKVLFKIGFANTESHFFLSLDSTFHLKLEGVKSLM